MATLNIKITSVTPPTYEKTSGSGDVSATGNIDVSGVAEDVDISWTLDDGLNRTFTASVPPGPITITNPDGSGPPSGVFGAGELSSEDKTLEVSDANTVGSNPAGNFQYTLHFTVGAADPSIKNR